jgi:hypothetical protein
VQSIPQSQQQPPSQMPTYAQSQLNQPLFPTSPLQQIPQSSNQYQYPQQQYK